MPPYLLDYADKPETGATNPPRKPAIKTKPLLTAGYMLAFAGSLAGNFFYSSQHQNLKKVADRQALQYDSLLSAKLYADRQVADLRKELMQLQQRQRRLSTTAPNPASP